MGQSPRGAEGSPRTHRLLFAVVVLLWLVADQLSKWWAVSRLTDDRTVDVAWTLRFNLAFNEGASFSLGGGYGRWIALVALAIVALLTWQAQKVTTRLGAVALAMIVGGALGNVLDRAFRSGGDGWLSGAVVDFIDVQWWPVFNIADIGVVVGAILLVVSSLLGEPGDDGADGADDADLGADGAGGPDGDTGAALPTDDRTSGR